MKYIFIAIGILLTFDAEAAKILCEFPSGEQRVVEVGDKGKCNGITLFDDRKDGALPENIELGKMVVQDGRLEKLPEAKQTHVDAVEAYTSAKEKNEARITLQSNYWYYMLEERTGIPVPNDIKASVEAAESILNK